MKALAALKEEKVKLKAESDKIINDLNEYKNQAKKELKAVYAFIQFSNTLGKQRFEANMKVNVFRRCWSRCFNRCPKRCGGGKYDQIEHMYIGGKWPTLVETVDPSLIIYKNLGIGKINRYARSMLTYLISFVVCLICFGLMMYSLALELGR